MYENRRLRKIFGPKRDEVTRDWRRLHSEELYDLYFSLNTCRLNKHEELEARCLAHVWIRKEIRTGI
jgi:hypothetical protein